VSWRTVYRVPPRRCLEPDYRDGPFDGIHRSLGDLGVPSSNLGAPTKKDPVKWALLQSSAKRPGKLRSDLAPPWRHGGPENESTGQLALSEAREFPSAQSAPRAERRPRAHRAKCLRALADLLAARFARRALAAWRAAIHSPTTRTCPRRQTSADTAHRTFIVGPSVDASS
jgi:hypothetical protein